MGKENKRKWGKGKGRERKEKGKGKEEKKRSSKYVQIQAMKQSSKVHINLRPNYTYIPFWYVSYCLVLFSEGFIVLKSSFLITIFIKMRKNPQLHKSVPFCSRKGVGLFHTLDSSKFRSQHFHSHYLKSSL